MANQTSQLQCPNCGGYKIRDVTPRPTSDGDKLIMFVLGFFTVGLTWWLLLSANNKNIPQDGSLYYYCNLCGYRWGWKSGTPMPEVTIRPDLIAKGEQKLKEEQKRRDDEYWEEQQKKRANENKK